nr:hypothetical protein [Tanacetum cinerariifolium]
MVLGNTRIDDALIDDDSNDASEQRKEEKDNKPLLQELTFVGTGRTANSKNAGGAKEMVSAINKHQMVTNPLLVRKQELCCFTSVLEMLKLIFHKDTWYSQGVSIIVSDGWSNMKHNPLINVLVVNSCGAMLMYEEAKARVNF